MVTIKWFSSHVTIHSLCVLDMSPSAKEPGADSWFQDTRQTFWSRPSIQRIFQSGIQRTKSPIEVVQQAFGCSSCFLVVPVEHKLHCLVTACFEGLYKLASADCNFCRNVSRVWIHQRLCKFHVQISYRSIDLTLLFFFDLLASRG